ncbi:hypothetical protein NLJ89_g6428 [Agrocybe chaxingu]|uniref:Uncharacterized protein n=1 Tax=Agrocybe chaxingu TaxID=84603 RepID=A0A9W8MUN0_9AGAR|nr:hypothetical protein NLJ89_g6428 [Agrocybe chaxingu]
MGLARTCFHRLVDDEVSLLQIEPLERDQDSKVDASRESEAVQNPNDVIYRTTVELVYDLPGKPPQGPEDSFLQLSDSFLSGSIDILAETSPNFSDNSDVFHTPELSVLGSEDDASQHMIPPDAPVNSQTSDLFAMLNSPSARTRSHTSSPDLIPSSPRSYPPPDSNDDADRVGLTSNATEVTHVGSETTHPLTSRQRPPSDFTDLTSGISAVLVINDLLTVQPETDGILSEDTGPSLSADTAQDSTGNQDPIRIESVKATYLDDPQNESKPVGDADKHSNGEGSGSCPTSENASRTNLPSPPRHTADKPNWALAPDVTPSTNTNPKQPRKSERRRGPRRGRHRIESNPENNSPDRASKPTDHEADFFKQAPFISETRTPSNNTGNGGTHQITFVSDDFRHISNSGNSSLPIPSSFRADKEKQDEMSSCTQVEKAPLPRIVFDSILPNLGAPSSIIYTTGTQAESARLTDKSMISEKAEKRPIHRSPGWKSVLALPTIVESNSDLGHEDLGKDTPWIIYQSSAAPHAHLLGQPAAKEIPNKPAQADINGGSKGAQSTGTKMPAATSAKASSDSRRIDSPSLTIPNSDDSRRHRLSWPSLEEELRFHAAAQQPLLWHGVKDECPSHGLGMMTPDPNLPLLKLDPVIDERLRESGRHEADQNRPYESFSLYNQAGAPAGLGFKPAPSNVNLQLQRAIAQTLQFQTDDGTLRSAFQSGIPVFARSHSQRALRPDWDDFKAGNHHAEQQRQHISADANASSTNSQKQSLQDPRVGIHRSARFHQETQESTIASGQRCRSAPRAIPTLAGNPKSAYHSAPVPSPATRSTAPPTSRKQDQFADTGRVTANRGSAYQQQHRRGMSSAGQPGVASDVFQGPLRQDNSSIRSFEGWLGRHGLGLETQFATSSFNASNMIAVPQGRGFQQPQHTSNPTREKSGDSLRKSFSG